MTDSLQMTRWRGEEANEGDDLESFALCSDCAGGRNAVAGAILHGGKYHNISWLEDYNSNRGYDETCFQCGYCPAEEEDEEEDQEDDDASI